MRLIRPRWPKTAPFHFFNYLRLPPSWPARARHLVILALRDPQLILQDRPGVRDAGRARPHHAGTRLWAGRSSGLDRAPRFGASVEPPAWWCFCDARFGIIAGTTTAKSCTASKGLPRKRSSSGNRSSASLRVLPRPARAEHARADELIVPCFKFVLTRSAVVLSPLLLVIVGTSNAVNRDGSTACDHAT